MPSRLVKWHTAIKSLERGGAVACPLMTHEPGRYRPDSCLCHIPKTRGLFHSKTPHLPCDTGNHCLVSIILPEETQAESRLLRVG